MMMYLPIPAETLFEEYKQMILGIEYTRVESYCFRKV